MNATERATHLIHPYPAKLLRHIPFLFLASQEVCRSSGAVLDPFCGSGTVLLESALSGRVGHGADSNPLARMIARVQPTVIATTQAMTVARQIARSEDRRVGKECVSTW